MLSCKISGAVMEKVKRLLWIVGIIAVASMLSDFFNSGLFMIIAVVLATAIAGGAGRGAKRSRFRSKVAGRGDANDLVADQHNHIEIGSAHLQHRCGSCTYWSGAKTTLKAQRGLYVHKREVGDCSFRRPGSRRENLKATAGQACADYSR